MKRAVGWGVIGPGRIANKVAGDFAHVPGAELRAVASRSIERARAFASQHAVPRAYGSYAELLGDPDVEVVYVATPHPHHHAVALAALDAGKALLVEKPFTATLAGAEAIVERARASRRFVMEAMWTRFQPAVAKARELLAEGAIGEVRGLQADLGICPPYDPTSRFYDLRQGGGAMLDLGVYLVSFAQMLFGMRDGSSVQLSVQGSLTPTGVDAESALVLGFPGPVARRATLTSSMVMQTPGQARIFGTEGHLDVLPRFHHPVDIVVHRAGEAPRPFSLPPLGGGYAHELIEVTERVREGALESAIMPLADTLAVQRVLEEACARLGVHHAEAE